MVAFRPWWLSIPQVLGRVLGHNRAQSEISIVVCCFRNITVLNGEHSKSNREGPGCCTEARVVGEAEKGLPLTKGCEMFASWMQSN